MTLPANSALLVDAVSSLRCACGAASGRWTASMAATLYSAGLALLLLVVPLAGAQTSAGTALQPKPLVVTGSSTIYPLMTDIVRRFEDLNRGASIEVRSV